jgi:predicted kinase
MTLELVIFSGLQASGKTSFYRDRLASTHVHISKDAWPNARNRESRQRRLIAEALANGCNVVVDNTNPTPGERAPLVAIARELGARAISYWFVTSVSDAVARNAAREGRARVPDAGIYSVAKKIVVPGADEGFDERWEVRLTAVGFVLEPLQRP